MHLETLYLGKLLWGLILAGIFLWLAVSFVRRINKRQTVEYNRLRVLLLLAAIGLAIYVVFFVQP
jgi:hypothetical protein